MPTTLYATRSDLLSALSLDSQAKLTNDPLRRWNVGVGDGQTVRFVTPFIETTTLKGYVNGAEVTPVPSVSTGSGSSSRDEVVFSMAPSVNAVVAVTADKDAINADVIDRALLAATETINGYLHAYLPVTDTAFLGALREKVVTLARVRLRGRRNLDVVDPIEMEWKAAIRWLELVAEGKIPLPSPAASVSSEAGVYVYGSHAAVFSDPDEEISL